MNLEFRGWTPVDTLYELKGFQLCERFYDSLWAYVVPLLIIAGFARLIYVAADENRMRHVVFQVIYLLFILFAISPVYVPVSVPAEYALQAKDLENTNWNGAAAQAGAPVVRAPRALVWMHFAADGLTRIMVRQVSPTFEKKAFAAPRAEVLLRQAHIRDPKLRERYFAFVRSCYVPVLAMVKQASGGQRPNNWWDPFGVPESVYAEIPAYNLDGDPVDARGEAITEGEGADCDAVLRELKTDLSNHVRTNDIQKDIGGLIDILLPGRAGEEVVERHVLYNETAALLATNEIQELEAAIPAYDLTNPRQDAVATPDSDAEALAPDTIETISGLTPWGPIVAAARATFSEEYREKWMKRLKWAKSKIVRTWQEVQSNIDKDAEGPALYYRVCTYGPYVYGLTMLVLIAFFPFAAFVSLLPKHWMALVTWGKLMLWVKLWIVLWAIFNGFHEWQFDTVQDADPANGIGNGKEAWSAIVAMYVMTPMLSGLIVSLLSAAAGGARGAAIALLPGGGGSSINAVATIQKIAGAIK